MEYTRAQIEAAIRRADKAGDGDAVRALGKQLTAMGKPKSFWQGVAEGMTPYGANANRIIGQINPIGGLLNAADSLVGKGSIPFAPQNMADAAERNTKQLLSRTGYQGSTTGKIVGNVLGAAPSALLPGSFLAQGAAGGVLGSNLKDPADIATQAAIGAAAGKAGELVARPAARVANAALRSKPVTSAVNAVGGIFGRGPYVPPPVMSPAQNMAAQALEKAGPTNVASSLGEAARLNVPMTLADTHPELRSLAGAAVRRSPSAAATAERVLMPRSRGQIDRFGQAIERDLGPVGNVPQISADLQQQARTAAAPLYEQAFEKTAWSPRVQQFLEDPIVNEGLTRGLEVQRLEALAGGEAFDPSAYSTIYNEAGVPNMRALDAVKRGLDDLLEQYRDKTTGRLALDQRGRAIEQVRQSLVGELDRINPKYAEARAAYAGPMQAQEALARGQRAVTQNPNQLGQAVAQQTPEQLGQMQLGYRSGLMDQANRLRFNSNPFSGTLGTPAAEARLGALYPDNPGTQNLLRTRDLEEQLAQTTNDILGNSKTAQRQLADEAFTGSGAGDMALDVATSLASGQMPIRSILGRGFGQKIKDARQFGLGKQAEAKAEELAPLLLNPNLSMREVQELLAAHIANRSAQRLLGYVGNLGALGGTVAGRQILPPE